MIVASQVLNNMKKLEWGDDKEKMQMKDCILYT